MGVIRTLSVSITARTTKFNKGMKKAQRRLKKFGRSLRGVARKLLGFKAALLGVVGIGALGFMVKRSLSAIDAQAKLSDRLGISIAKLQAYARTASLAGTEQASLNKGLELLARRVGEARDGVGEGTEVLKKFGLAGADFLDLSLDNQFEIIADKIGGMNTQQEKAAASADLFGRAGVGLVNIFDGGSKAFEDSTRFLKEFGLEMTRLDARKVEVANDAIDDLRRVASLTFDRLTVELAPFITATSKMLLDMARDGETTLGVKIVSSIQKAALWFAELADAGERMALRLNIAWTSLAASMNELSRAVSKFRELMEPNSGNLNRARMAGIEEISREYAATLTSLRAELAKFEAGQSVTWSASVKKKIAEINAEAKKHAKILLDLAAKQKKNLKDTTGAGISGPLAKVGGGDDLGATAARRAEKAFTRAGEAGVSAFESIATSTAKATDAVKILISQMARIAINEFASKPLIGVIQSAAAGLFGGAAQDSIDAENFVNDLTPNFSTQSQLVLPQSTINQGITSSSDTQRLIGSIDNRSLFE